MAVFLGDYFFFVLSMKHYSSNYEDHYFFRYDVVNSNHLLRVHSESSGSIANVLRYAKGETVDFEVFLLAGAQVITSEGSKPSLFIIDGRITPSTSDHA
mmetsp:Transcript_20697/g.31706  ORF Transcript_20697/g.31706 Transcript_20697/m.31706 type:complete len:99 (-) Transcript_20697:324-620(-)|eukprot:CAMPEP_0170509570 /NCGR_PEP_ID=MMETSP0208-20121228/65285_1 /TAXON_ID=197538 /ORGANISM="Strombidium inclinatum, Strain S3" /LENGTH=98 /DNA_ID=CAMNT_0010792941 /DNA_START=205 /DNA_END=501 /DNA_ORIENTATION=-